MVTKKKLTKEEWEAMTGTDMSFILPSDGGIETALESSLNDSGNREQAKSVEQVEVPFEPQQSPTGREEGIPLSQRRISSRQRKLSLDEYRKTFLQVPRIEDRKPVFVSGEVRDRLDEFVRRLGGRKMSVSGLLENIARLHLEIYSEDFEQWRKL
ncbi:DUF3408 domain-containing protein [Phocaeicola dorei]|uniref:DUF3408 domain-containing protein n=1 Tax=Phocaeicola dorei TaxID=357276 RepID=UPI00321AD7CF